MAVWIPPPFFGNLFVAALSSISGALLAGMVSPSSLCVAAAPGTEFAPVGRLTRRTGEIRRRRALLPLPLNNPLCTLCALCSAQLVPGAGNGPNVVPGHRGPVRNVNEDHVEAVDTVVPELGERRAVHQSGLAFSTRMMVLQLAVVVLVIILTAGVYGWLTYQRLSDEIGSKSLAVAQSLAVEEPIRTELGAVATADPPR